MEFTDQTLTLAAAVLTGTAVVIGQVTIYLNGRSTRKAAERAEARAAESLHKSESNSVALTKVATAVQLDGQLTLFRELVLKEADGRIKAAEARTAAAFLRGQEHERADPPATAANLTDAIGEVRQMIADQNVTTNTSTTNTATTSSEPSSKA